MPQTPQHSFPFRFFLQNTKIYKVLCAILVNLVICKDTRGHLYLQESFDFLKSSKKMTNKAIFLWIYHTFSSSLLTIHCLFWLSLMHLCLKPKHWCSYSLFDYRNIANLFRIPFLLLIFLPISVRESKRDFSLIMVCYLITILKLLCLQSTKYRYGAFSSSKCLSSFYMLCYMLIQSYCVMNSY